MKPFELKFSRLEDIMSSPVKKPAPVKEGLAEILPIESNDVFYNPAQVFNRDLSVLMLNIFSEMKKDEFENKSTRSAKKLRKKLETSGSEAEPKWPGLSVLEALGASGLRSIRYAKEVPNLRKIVTNDLDPNAVQHMRRNFAHNGVDTLEKPEVVPSTADAISLMYGHREGVGEPFDVIDLDPYGSASPFIDGAVQAVSDGGLLCVTCTDSAVLCGNHSETCYTRYGGIALKASYCHEASLRLVLSTLAHSAARYKRSITPLAAFSIDFYARVFVRVEESPKEASLLAKNIGTVLQCVNCEFFKVNPLGVQKGQIIKPASLSTPSSEAANGCAGCPECGGRLNIGGPMWIGPLYSDSFLERAKEACESPSKFPGITAWPKVKSLVYGQASELHVPLFYSLPSLQSAVGTKNCPLIKWKGALRSLGYLVSHYHKEPQAIKTDAPMSVAFDLLREWCRQLPEGEKPKKPKIPSILSRPQWHTEINKDSVNFSEIREDENEKNEKVNGKRKVPLFLPNPTKNWGPKPRAKKVKIQEKEEKEGEKNEI